MAFRRAFGPMEFTLAVSVLLGCTGSGGSGNSKGGAAGDANGGGNAGSDPGGGEGGSSSGGTTGNGGSSGKGGGAPGGGGSAGSGGGSGNAGTGGGMGGATPVGGQGGVAMNPIPCAQRPYCNDFEAVAAGQRPAGSYRVDGGNTLMVVSDKAFSGKNSLYIAASQGNSRYTFTIPAGKLVNPKRVSYMKMMVWLDNLPGGVSPGHWDIMSISGKAQEGTTAKLYDAFVSFGGSQDVNSRLLYGGDGSDCDKGGRPQSIPLQKWSCIEFKADETSEYAYGVNIDGEEFGPATIPVSNNGASCFMPGANMGNWYVPDGTTFSAGWQYYHTQGRPIKMWIDDVVVDEKPIGCP